MSQFFVGVSAGNLPPEVATSYIVDLNGDDGTSPGTAIPSSNELLISGASTLLNNENGIETIASPNLSNEIFITLTNRTHNTLTTTDAIPTLLVNLALPEDGVYTFNVLVSCINTTDNSGASYNLFFGIILTAGVATKLGLEDKIVNEAAGMAACDVSVSVSGGNAEVFATGLAGKTINWAALTTYNFVGP